LENLESRAYQAGDEYGIVRLYNIITGSCRTNEQYRWEWLETPEGLGSIWVITESGSGEIVGHHGLIPIQLNYFGKTILLGKTENTILHPKYLGTGIYFIHERRFLQEGKERYDLLCTTFAHGTIRKIRRKLGYKVVGRYLTYTKGTKNTYIKKLMASLIENKIPYSGLRIFCNGIGHILSYPLTIIFSKRGKIDKNITFEKVENINAIAGKIDQFWDRNKDGFGITIDRTSNYLKWRIFENPYVKYEFLIAMKLGKAVGYVITKISASDANLGVIVDLVCEQHDEILFNTILDAAVRRFISADVHAVSFRTLDSNNFLNKCLSKNGFLPIQKIAAFMPKQFTSDIGGKEVVLLVNIINKNINYKKIYNPDYWYYTDLFHEGIR
jgi:hypothetical protein